MESLTSQALGLAQVPERLPRICEGLAVVTSGGAIVLEGSGRRLRLTGKSAAAVIPPLVRLLDGRHDLAEVCLSLNITRPQLDQVLDLLDEHGLVERVPAEPRETRVTADVGTYLSRMASTAGGHRCAEDIEAALAETAVLIIAPPHIAGRVSADLAETGVGSVVCRPAANRASAGDIAAIASAPRGMVVVFDGEEDDQLGIIAALPGEPGVPVLRFAATGDHVEIGPLFYGSRTACGRCFRDGQDTLTAAPQADAHSPASQSAPLAAGLVVTEILAVTVQLTPPTAPGRVARYSTSDFTMTAWDIVPEPGCGTCGATIPDAAAGLVEVYEQQMALPPPVLTWKGPVSAARERLFMELQTRRNVNTSAPAYVLPESGTAAPSGARPGEISEYSLAYILRRVAGFRAAGIRPAADSGAGIPRRWAPTGGNLGSAEIYVAADGPIFGLPGSIFKYDDIEHRLLSVSRDVVPLAQLLRNTDLTATADSLVLVMVGAIWRLSQKYKDFSARLAHLDAGCAALQLTLAATGCGLGLSFAATWDHEPEDALELRPGSEIITAIARLSGRELALGNGAA